MGYSAWRRSSTGLEALRFRLMVNVVCVEQPQASDGEAQHEHYAGLDVSVNETSVCIIDETGRICREVKVATHPDDLIALLWDPTWQLERVGLEAGPLSQWLFSGLAEAGTPAICIETRHAKAFLKA
jgi:transposase